MRNLVFGALSLMLMALILYTFFSTPFQNSDLDSSLVDPGAMQVEHAADLLPEPRPPNKSLRESAGAETDTAYLNQLARQSRDVSERLRRARDRREASQSGSGEVLSEAVFRSISRIQELSSQQQWADAADLMSELYGRWDTLNNFERTTLLNFYTNLFLANNMIPEAIYTFEAILDIPVQRRDIALRSLRALGQLNMADENYQESISYYNRYLEESGERDGTVLLGLANSHYSIQDYQSAIPYLNEHIDLLQAQEKPVDRNKYSLLNLLYIETEDFNAAIAVTQKMIDDYDQTADWRNLNALYAMAGVPELQADVMDKAAAAGHVDSEGNWVDR